MITGGPDGPDGGFIVLDQTLDFLLLQLSVPDDFSDGRFFAGRAGCIGQQGMRMPPIPESVWRKV